MWFKKVDIDKAKYGFMARRETIYIAFFSEQFE